MSDDLLRIARENAHHITRLNMAGFGCDLVVARCLMDMAAKIESDAKVIAALREALEELRVLGEQGAPPDYTRWLAFHDRVAKIAQRGLAIHEQTVANCEKAT